MCLPPSMRPAVRRVPRVLAVSLVGLLLAVGSMLASTSGSQVARAQSAQAPDIVLILTDDQRADSLPKMDRVQKLLVQRGMRLRSAIVSNPLCCPSRATILTGRYAHTTGVYTNGGPNGGWPLFASSGAEANTIATALDDAGYRTALVGKYMNDYDQAGPYVPPGWDRWFAFANDNGRYYDYDIYNGARFVHFGTRPRAYSTDVLAARAEKFIRNAPTSEPMFLLVAPYAPHGRMTPAPRHVGAFSGAHVSLSPSVGEANVADKPEYIRNRPRPDPDDMRRLVRRHWEVLLAVDDLVSRVVDALRDTGRGDDTIVIFMSDNGFAFGEHRWTGKLVPYEESIRVPFVIRSPGQVPAGTVSDALVSNVDVAPTLAEFAGVSFPGVDGVSLAPLVTGSVPSVRDDVLLEFLRFNGTVVPTYCGVRTPSYSFVRYGTGEEELYDLGQDPYQLQNVVSTRPTKANQLRTLTTSLCQPVPPGFAW